MHGFRVIDLLSDRSLAVVARFRVPAPDLPVLRGERPAVAPEDEPMFAVLDRLMRERASVLPRAR